MKVYTFKATPQLIARIDEIAKKLELTRGQVIRNFIEASLDDYELIEAVGLVGLVRMKRDMFSTIKEYLLTGRLKLNKNGKLTCT